MRYASHLFLLGILLTQSGCVAKTALDIATAPVRVAGKAVDLATTSQSEADEKRGREIRQREEELGKLDRQYRKEQKRCEDGDERACERAATLREDVQAISRTLPAELPE